MLVTLIRTILIYLVVVFGLRLMGKRQLGELQPSELVLAILASDIATLPIEDTGLSLLSGAIPILTLVCFDVLLSALTLKSQTLRRWFSGTPRILIRDGVIDQKEMKNLRYSVDDLMEQLRHTPYRPSMDGQLRAKKYAGWKGALKKAFSDAHVPKTPFLFISAFLPGFPPPSADSLPCLGAGGRRNRIRAGRNQGAPGRARRGQSQCSRQSTRSYG